VLQKKGAEVGVAIAWVTQLDLLDSLDPERGIPSARDTSVPPAVVSRWQAIRKIKDPGVFPAEATVDPEPFFVKMGKTKIRVEEHFTETKKFY
jgi:hypothetical protein